MSRHTPWCFGAGVLLFQLLPALPPAAAWAGLAALAVAALALRPLRWLVACVLGFAWTWLHVADRLAERWPAHLAGQVVAVEGVVAELAAPFGGGRRFELAELRVDGVPMDGRVRLAAYDPAPGPRLGERWRLHARLRSPRGFMNPGGFDFEGWLFRERIVATGYVVPQTGDGPIAGEGGGLLALRAAIASRLEHIAGASPHAGVVVALGVGLTHGMDGDAWDVLQATGTSHLISISGLHVGLVAAGVAWLVRRSWGWSAALRARCAPVDAAALWGLGAAFGYALLAGFAIPTLRALLMLGVVLLRGLLRRHGPGEAALAQAFAVVLVADPLAPLFPGFWLSFVAVAALPLGVLGGFRGWIAQVRTQWVVTLLIAPLTLGVFQTVSLIAPLVNLVAIPLFGFLVVPPVLLGILLLPAGDGVAAVPLSLAVGTLDLAWPWLERAAASPVAAWSAGPRPVWVLLAAQLAFLLCVAPRGLPGRWLAAPLLLPLVLWRPAAPEHGAFELAVLDVGQGLAVAVRTARHALLYDAGPRFRGGDAGDLVVAPYLEARGVRTLDLMIVSHDDEDHRGGVASVRARVPVRQTLTGGWRDGPRCEAGRRWHWDGVDFELLHPARGSAWDDNDGSCVLRIAGAGGSVLLTGDIEQAAERALVAAGAPLAADVVVAPHHGSATSSSEALIARAHARYVVYSAGHANRWGFPAAEVRARWREAGARELSTAESGAVVFDVSPVHGVTEPYEHRRAARRYWTAR